MDWIHAIVAWPLWAKIVSGLSLGLLLALLQHFMNITGWLLRRYDHKVLAYFDNPKMMHVEMVATGIRPTEGVAAITAWRIANRIGRWKWSVARSLRRLEKRRLVIGNPDGTWKLR